MLTSNRFRFTDVGLIVFLVYSGRTQTLVLSTIQTSSACVKSRGLKLWASNATDFVTYRGLFNIHPVSYTHLDVYKRQVVLFDIKVT